MKVKTRFAVKANFAGAGSEVDVAKKNKGSILSMNKVTNNHHLNSTIKGAENKDPGVMSDDEQRVLEVSFISTDIFE